MVAMLLAGQLSSPVSPPHFLVFPDSVKGQLPLNSWGRQPTQFMPVFPFCVFVCVGFLFLLKLEMASLVKSLLCQGEGLGLGP